MESKKDLQMLNHRNMSVRLREGGTSERSSQCGDSSTCVWSIAYSSFLFPGRSERPEGFRLEMQERGSISRCIDRLKTGEESAVRTLWNRYRGRMYALANLELGNCSRSVSDEEDVVASAFAAFLRRADQGAYAAMETRDDLWRLLAKITRTHAWEQCRFFGRIRRRMNRNCSLADERLLRQLASDSPPPDVVAACTETMRRLLEKLDQPELREVALARLSGLNNREIAARQNRSVRTIERRLMLIKNIWQHELETN